MTDLLKLADTMHPASPQPSDEVRMRASNILREAAGADVAGIMQLARNWSESWNAWNLHGTYAALDLATSKRYSETLENSRNALETALRLALAQAKE